jgi:hypothetical protein
VAAEAGAPGREEEEDDDDAGGAGRGAEDKVARRGTRVGPAPLAPHWLRTNWEKAVK